MREVKRRPLPGRYSLTRADAESVEFLAEYTAGKPMQQIAAETGFPYATVYKRITSVLAETKSMAVEEHRKVQDAQLDDLVAFAYEKMADPDVDTQFKGAAALIKAMERRARLHGLDAPTQHVVQGEVVSVSDETRTRIEEAQRRLSALTARAGTPALRAVE